MRDTSGFCEARAARASAVFYQARLPTPLCLANQDHHHLRRHRLPHHQLRHRHHRRLLATMRNLLARAMKWLRRSKVPVALFVLLTATPRLAQQTCLREQRQNRIACSKTQALAASTVPSHASWAAAQRAPSAQCSASLPAFACTQMPPPMARFWDWAPKISRFERKGYYVQVETVLPRGHFLGGQTGKCTSQSFVCRLSDALTSQLSKLV